MSEKSYDICLNIDSSKMSIAAFDKITKKNIFFKDYNFINEICNKINFLEIQNTLKDKIIEIEKNIGHFVNDLNLMIDTNESFFVDLSIAKDIDGKIVEKKDILYLIQNAKQEVLRSYLHSNVVHIVISGYIADNNNYEFFPKNISCKRLSLDIRFIFLPKKLISNIEDIFNKNQISIKKVICTQYVNSIIETKSNICESGLKIIQGFNEKEVMMVPKKIEKKGFFERLFHLFR